MKTLSKLQHAVLEHIGRYRIGVTRFCCSALQGRFAELTRGATKRALRELCEGAGLLQREQLLGRNHCYTLSKTNGEPRQLSERGVATAMAMLSFCCADAQRRRQKLLPRELASHFPDLVIDESCSEHYYLAEDRLGYLRVDLGGRGRWDRVMQYCTRDIVRHEARFELAKLMLDGFMEFTVATATHQKARRLRQAMLRRPLHPYVNTQVIVVPELLHLIAPPPLDLAHIPQRGF